MTLPNRLDLHPLNRTEAAKSVVLGMLLRCPGVAARLVDSLVRLGVKMRGEDGSQLGIRLLPETEAPQVTALFHTWRDFKRAGIEADLAEKNEIDVLAVWPNSLVLGLELKWQSSISNLKAQLKAERASLQTVANYYGAKYTSLVAVLPLEGNATDEADGVLTAEQVVTFAREVAAAAPGDGSIERYALGELELMIPRRFSWKTLSLCKLLRDDTPPTHKFLGFTGGLAALREQSAAKLRDRPHWKVLDMKSHRLPNQPPNHRWVPLGPAVDIIREKLAALSI